MRALLALLIVVLAATAIYFATQGGGDPAQPVTVPGADPTVAEVQDPPNGTVLDDGAGTGTERIEVPVKQDLPETQSPVSTANKTEWGNRLFGRLLGQDQRPVAGAQVTLTLFGPNDWFGQGPEDRAADRQLTSDKEGGFSFTDLHPDKNYTVIAWHAQSGLRVESDLRVAMGASEELVIVLEPGATLSGTVTDTGGLAVAGAELKLDLATLADAASASTLRVLSAADGSYSFTHIASSNYRLEVWKDGYGRRRFDNLNVSGEEPTEFPVVLEVAYLIAGIVTAQDGSPVEGASVEAYGEKARGGPSSRVRTDAEGRFTLDDVDEGSYRITARATGYKVPRAIQINTGDLNVALVLEAQPTLSGRVLDPSGAPLTDFTVQLRTRMANSTETIPVRNSRHKISNSPDGSYLLHFTRPGEYLVEAINPDYAPSFSEPVLMQGGDSRGNVNVTMTQGGIIRGRLVGPNGPVAGARVRTHHTTFVVGDPFFAALNFGQATEVEVLSAEDGSFELTTLTAATYQIYVTSADHSPLAQREIVVSEGSEIDLGPVTLSTGGSVTGSVSGPDGEPLSGVLIQITLDAQAVNDPHGATYTTRTRADGTYLLAHVPAGPYALHAQRRQGTDTLSGIEDVQATRRTITVTEGGSLAEHFSLN